MLGHVHVDAALTIAGMAERQVVRIAAETQAGAVARGLDGAGAERDQDDRHEHAERAEAPRAPARPATADHWVGSSKTNSVPPSGLAATIFAPTGPRKRGMVKVRPDTTATYCLPPTA